MGTGQTISDKSGALVGEDGGEGVPSGVGERGRGRARGEAAVEVLEEFVAGQEIRE